MIMIQTFEWHTMSVFNYVKYLHSALTLLVGYRKSRWLFKYLALAIPTGSPLGHPGIMWSNLCKNSLIKQKHSHNVDVLKLNLRPLSG